MAESEMVERVARALCVAHGSAPDMKCQGKTHVINRDGLPTLLPDHYGPLWKLYTADARAALEAMREPTQEMCLSVGDRWGAALEADYTAMISAALGQEGTEG